MPITKRDHKLEEVRFTFDQNGDVEDIQFIVNFELVEKGRSITRVREVVKAWDDLNPADKAKAKAVGKRLKALADAV